MSAFEGRTVVIAGGSRGVGRATARAIAAEGGRLVLFARDPSRLEAAEEEARRDGAPEVIVVAGDLAAPADVDRLAMRAAEQGPVDAVFCSAGFAPFAPLSASEPAFVARALEVNVAGPIHLARAMEPHLREGAAVLLTGSGMHARPLAHASVWVATTAAMSGLARALAVEWAPRRIRVNTLSHGPVDTPIYGDYGMPEAALESLKADLARKTLLGRLARPEEIAQLAVALLRPGGFVTATEVIADGGWAVGAP